MIDIDFVGNVINDSLQIGDLAYYITPSQSGGFGTSIDTTTGEYTPPILIGVITNFQENVVQVPGACSINPSVNTTQQLCDAAGGVFTPPVIGSQLTVDNANTNVLASDIGAGAFIMFGKDSSVNISGLIGYYAEATFKNNSTEKAELYSVASEITPSSK